MSKVWRRRITAMAMLLAAYVLIYCGLSTFGSYDFAQSGQVRYSGSGMAVSDLVQWQPRFAFCQWFRGIDGTWRIRANGLGYGFAPLILLDQWYVHRTTRLFDPETGEVIPEAWQGRAKQE